LFVDCPENFVLAGIPLVCPTQTEVDALVEMIKLGDIVWHRCVACSISHRRGPFNLQPENMDATLFSYALTIAEDLANKYNGM
jgi:hypothetical protein